MEHDTVIPGADHPIVYGFAVILQRLAANIDGYERMGCIINNGPGNRHAKPRLVKAYKSIFPSPF